MKLIIPFATLLAATPASAGFTTYEQNVDLEGVFFLSPKEETIAAFQACLDNASSSSSSSDEQAECDFYINPHTDYSYRSNPSAIGIYRGQFHFDHTDNEGKHHFVVDYASTKIINDVMIASGLQASGGANSAGMCDGKPYNELDPDAASAFDTEVVWDEGNPDSVDDDTVTLISSKVTLKEDLSTIDIRKTQCAAFNGGDFDSSDNEYFNNLNGARVGQHIHLGDPTGDGPPAIGFCGPFGPSILPACKDVLDVQFSSASSED